MILAMFNVPLVYAVDDVTICSALFSRKTAKIIVGTVGVLATIEGCSNAQFGKSPFLPLPKVSNNATVDLAGKAFVGLVEAGIGLASIAYVLQ